MDAHAGGRGESPDQVGFRLNLFAVMWAAAALFHLAGNPRPAWIPVTPAFTAVALGIAVAAGLVLLNRGRRAALVALCLLIPVSAWLEAPVVGNHWVLAAIVSLTYLVAAGMGGRGAGYAEIWRRFAPAARLSLVIAYGFAGFAKLNTDFFDPAVSCAVFYQDQLVRSWGLGALAASGQPALGLWVAIGAAAVELSVGALLAVPRTRRWALLLALPFHWLLALDFSQHFWDFSAVLFAGFLLFADDAMVEGIRGRLDRLRLAVRPAVWRVVAVLGGLFYVAVLAATAIPTSPVLRGVAVLGAHGAWLLAGTAVLGIVLLAVLHTRPSVPVGVLRGGVALLIPVLVFANGLTPYLEIKTGFGWNMYSNLHTAAGESNHLLVRSTLDVTGLQDDRVQVLETSDERLQPLVDSDFEIVYSEFREYAHAFPQESVTYRRGGQTFAAPRLADDPAGNGGVSPVSHRLQSFRLVDQAGADRCQALFTPAR